MLSVTADSNIWVSAFPTDNRILECALEAGSGYVVTGDKDMLRVGTFGSIPIIMVADFLEIFSEPH